MAIQGFFTGDVKIRDLNGVLKAVDGIVEVATDAGTVTSVGLTVGSTGTDVNVANSPVTTSGNITLNLPTASATNRGLLSSTDWAIFDAKQGSITLTTIGSSGPATLTSGTLNIPNYGEALSGYVTLGTTQTITGQKTFNTNTLQLAINGTSQKTVVSNSPIDSGSYSLGVNFLGFNASNNLYFSKSGDNNGIFAFNNSQTRIYTLQNASGTLAFTSDIPSLTFSAPLVNTAGVVSIPAATGSVNGYLTSTDWTTFNSKQNTLTLTTTGSSGASTLVGATLNIPTYTLSGLGGVPTSRQLTINGTAYDLSADRSWSVGTVTSVGLTMPSAFVVSSSPVTGSGTISVTGAGNATQYIRGDGALATFPTNGGGGGASVSYYLNGSVNQGTFGGNTYYEMNKTPIIGAGTDFTINADGYIAQFITDANDPALLKMPAGNWNFETYFQASSGGGSPTFYIELYKYNGTTFTLIASNSGSPKLINDGTNIEAYFTALAVPETVLTLTDRIAIRIYVTHSGRTITLHTENSHLCQIITTFTTGLAALNGLTEQVQYLATGTSGTDFNISSVTATHTFNLPTASATNRGALSTADWTTFNSKQNALTLTTTGSSGSSTLVGATLNVPTYTLSGLGGVPTSRQLTINGTAYDLSADRSWSVGTITGTLTTNFVPKATGATSLADSLIYDNGSGVGINTTSPYDSSNFKLDVNGGVLIKSTSGTLAQLILINSNPATGGNNGFVQFTAGGNTATAFAELQSYYGISIASGALRLQPAGGQVLIGTRTTSAFLTDINGTLRVSGQLTLGSTITDGTNTYTLPSSTGTLALVGGSGVGTVTSVGLFSATSGVTIGSTPITTSGTITLAIATASGLQNGLLSSSDWTTFNNKQNALINPVTGTGTTNYLPKFTGTSTIGNSQVFDNGSFVGIGRTTNASAGWNLAVQNGLTVTQGTTETQLFGYFGDAGVGTYSNHNFKIRVNNTDRAIFDTSGNLGLGVTPSAWSTSFGIKVIDLGSKGSVYASDNDANLSFNQFFDGTNAVYKTTGTAGRFAIIGNEFQWRQAPSGTAGNAISFTQAMTLNASGFLGIGETNPTSRLHIQSSASGGQNIRVVTSVAAGRNYMQFANGSGDMGYIGYGGADGKFYINNQLNDDMLFVNNGATRLTIAPTGAATFSSSVTAGGNIVANKNNSTDLQLVLNQQTSGYASAVNLVAATDSGAIYNYISSGTTGNTSMWQIGGGASVNTMVMYTGGSERMRITSGGNVGIGTTSPTKKLDVAGSDAELIRLSSTATNGSYLGFTNSGTLNGAIGTGANIISGISNSDLGLWTTGLMAFQTNGSERMRITSGGNVLIGATSQDGRLAVNGVATSTSLVTFYSSTAGDVGQAGLMIGKQDNNTTTSQVILRAAILSTGAGAGQINMNGANSLAFGTYSDKRLKENIVNIPSQLENIMALRPVEFDYIQSEGGGHQTGFIAQEIQKVYSDAVGTREDGMLTVSGWSKTEARLVKAIQELKAELDTLKNK